MTESFSSKPSVFVHVLTYDSEAYIVKCLEAIFASSEFVSGDNLHVHVTDNASQDSTVSLLRKHFGDRLQITENSVNLGYCAGHNQGAYKFLNSACDYFLVMNPDVVLEPLALKELCAAYDKEPQLGSVCPKLYRADEDLEAVQPLRLDAAGMYMTSSLRHFDRGSEKSDAELYKQDSYVFGGSGACLLMNKAFIEDVSFRGESFEDDLYQVYPELSTDSDKRIQLFDEAFFAYREDADLAWRSQILGWKCAFVSSAIAYHKRVVLPERRRKLEKELNLLGVKNRFLLQFNNYSCARYPRTVIPGFLWRNLLVAFAVLTIETSSLKGLKQAWLLRKRAWERKRLVYKRARASIREVAQWFSESYISANQILHEPQLAPQLFSEKQDE